jgi:hypothetical protein
VGPSVIGAAPRAVQCDGAKLLPLRANLGGGGVDSRLAGISNNTTVLGGGDDADADGSSGAAAGDRLSLSPPLCLGSRQWTIYSASNSDERRETYQNGKDEIPEIQQFETRGFGPLYCIVSSFPICSVSL